MNGRRDSAIIAILIAFGLLLSGGFIVLSDLQDQDTTGLLPTFRTNAQLQDFVHQSQGNDIWQDYFTEAMSGNAAGADSVRHSTTNIQVEGVDEADSVKTDGAFLYIASGASISIVKAYPADELANATVIDIIEVLGLGEGYSAWIQGIYLDDGRMVAVVSVSGPYLPYNSTGDDAYGIYAPAIWRMPEERTVIAVFSLDGNGGASLVGTVGTSGYGVTSRMSDGVVYLVTQHFLWTYDSVVSLPKEWQGNESDAIPVTDVHYDPGCKDPASFLNIMALDVASMESNLTSILTGYASNIYVSSEAMYLTFQQWNGGAADTVFNDSRGTNTLDAVAVSSDTTTTTIYKIGLDGLHVEARSRGVVPGYLINQFSMDEDNGLLRVATTFSWDNQRNAVYVLDEGLAIIGALEDLAPGERIFSCRFSGDTLYLVTFRQVDPLFVIDLSDPSAPKVQGELKVPGYSSYLHPIADGLLVGIGMENSSLKVSLFDVSDPSLPTELDNLVIPGWSYSEALWDHKAVTYDPVTGSLIIPVSSWDQSTYNCTSGAYVFTITDTAIELKGKVQPGPGEYVMRAQFIGDWLYTISDTTVYVNSLLDLSEHGRLVYKERDYGYLPMLMAEGEVAAIGAVR
ncbi:MAG: beta-propeller domain-containing protein [Methanomassiliicoccales archaeon]|nr:beta-propeller domain-containing protein [Methanomassiliicoccales archaeon]